MRYLLDTHVIIWAALRSARVSKAAAAIIRNSENELFVSAISGYEIAYKVRQGKLGDVEELAEGFTTILPAEGYQILPLNADAALKAARFPARHGDPFDRMIAAQASVGAMSILSADSALDQFGIRRIW